MSQGRGARHGEQRGGQSGKAPWRRRPPPRGVGCCSHSEILSGGDTAPVGLPHPRGAGRGPGARRRYPSAASRSRCWSRACGKRTCARATRPRCCACARKRWRRRRAPSWPGWSISEGERMRRSAGPAPPPLGTPRVKCCYGRLMRPKVPKGEYSGIEPSPSPTCARSSLPIFQAVLAGLVKGDIHIAISAAFGID